MMFATLMVAMVCATALVAYRWHLNERPKDQVLSDLEDRIDATDFKFAHQPETVPPPCTREEFERVVKQLNTLTSDMGVISQTADSLRTAVGMQQMGRRQT